MNTFDSDPKPYFMKYLFILFFLFLHPAGQVQNPGIVTTARGYSGYAPIYCSGMAYSIFTGKAAQRIGNIIPIGRRVNMAYAETGADGQTGDRENSGPGSGSRRIGVNPIWIVWVLTVLALLSRWMGHDRGYCNGKAVRILFLVSAAELVYFFTFDRFFGEFSGPLWFTHPLYAGFFRGMVISLAFYVVAAIQVVAAMNYLEDKYGEDTGATLGSYLVGGAGFLVGMWYIPFVPVGGVILGCAGALVMVVQCFRIIFSLSDGIATGFANAVTYLVVTAAGTLLIYNFPSSIGYLFDYIAN